MKKISRLLVIPFIVISCLVIVICVFLSVGTQEKISHRLFDGQEIEDETKSESPEPVVLTVVVCEENKVQSALVTVRVANEDETFLSHFHVEEGVCRAELQAGTYRISVLASDAMYFDLPEKKLRLNQPTTLQFTLERKYSLSAFVVNPDGHPVPDALVSISEEKPMATDPHGYVSFFPIRDGTYAVRITHPDYSPIMKNITPQSKPYHFILSNGGLLRVVTVDETAVPTSGVDVICQRNLAQGGYTIGKKTSNVDGYTCFDQIESGTYTLQLDPPFPSVSKETEIFVQAGDIQDITLTFTRKSFDINGIVLDYQTHDPVEGVTVVCQGNDYDFNSTTPTKNDGRFRFESLRHGQYHLYLENTPDYISGNYSGQTRTGFKPAPMQSYYVDDDVYNVILYAKKAWKIEGMVVDAGNKPVAGANVHGKVIYSVPFAYHSTSQSLLETISAEDGSFVLYGSFENENENAKLSLKAKHEDYISSGIAMDIPKPGEVIKDAVIEMKRQYNVFGEVLNEKNKPVQEAVIYFTEKNPGSGDDPNQITLSVAGKDGIFKACIDKGKYQYAFVQAFAKGYASSDIQSLVLDSPDTHITIYVKKSAEHEISGYVCDRNYQPVAGAAIHLNEIYEDHDCHNTRNKGSVVTQTDEQGVFRIPENPFHSNQPDVEYKVTAEKEEGNVLLSANVCHVKPGMKDLFLIVDSQYQEKAEVYGRVIRNQEPVQDFKIMMIDGNATPFSNHDAAWKYFQSLDGTFHLKDIHVKTKSKTIVAYHREYGLAYSDRFQLEANEVRRDIEIVYPPMRLVRGRVLNEESHTPVSEAKLWYTKVFDYAAESPFLQSRRRNVISGTKSTMIDQFSDTVHYAVTGDDGYFDILLPMEDVWLHTQPEGFQPFSMPVRPEDRMLLEVILKENKRMNVERGG